jgi:spore coat protein U-like protein
MIRRIRIWLWLGGLFTLCQWLAPAGFAPLNVAQASVAGVNCTATVTGINFGNVDPSLLGSSLFSGDGNSNLQTTGFLTYYCTNTSNVQKNVDVCISLGNPGGGRQRSLSSPGNGTISYDLYTDANNASSWGSKNTSTWGSPYAATVTVPAGGSSAPATVPIYATIDSTQFIFTGSGTYSATYAGADVAIDTGPSGCAGASGGGTITGFTVSAVMRPTCQVKTDTLDFGVASTGDPSNASATTTVTVACSRHTGYRVGLDNGKNFNGTTRRMRGGPTHNDYVPYGLYRDTGCTVPWGNTDGIDTVTGTSSTQDFRVCGKVPPNQGMLPDGDYFDAVTVYVYY